MPAAPSDYEKAHQTYRTLAKAAADGDKQALKDKAKVMNDIRNIEREAARAGTVLSATYQGDKVKTNAKETSSKRSLQEEYVRKFDGETMVKLGNANQEVKEQTLREYHAKRLGVRA